MALAQEITRHGPNRPTIAEIYEVVRAAPTGTTNNNSENFPRKVLDIIDVLRAQRNGHSQTKNPHGLESTRKDRVIKIMIDINRISSGLDGHIAERALGVVVHFMIKDETVGEKVSKALSRLAMLPDGRASVNRAIDVFVLYSPNVEVANAIALLLTKYSNISGIFMHKLEDPKVVKKVLGISAGGKEDDDTIGYPILNLILPGSGAANESVSRNKRIEIASRLDYFEKNFDEPLCTELMDAFERTTKRFRGDDFAVAAVARAMVLAAETESDQKLKAQRALKLCEILNSKPPKAAVKLARDTTVKRNRNEAFDNLLRD